MRFVGRILIDLPDWYGEEETEDILKDIYDQMKTLNDTVEYEEIAVTAVDEFLPS